MKVIVYGLGNEWSLYEETIRKNYEIVALYDKDSSKVKNPRIKGLNDIAKREEKILITSSRYWREISEDLKSVGISEDRIIYFFETDARQYHWGIKPIAGKSYSGEFEDWLIDSILTKLNVKYTEMNYVELGVMDPTISSNTYYFYERGAKGILVEANPKLIAKIKKIRPRDKVINKAIYKRDKDKVFFYVANEPGLSSVLPDHLEEVEDWEKIGLDTKIEVETISINTVLNEIEIIDLLSIDLEGYDYQALSMMDFEKYRPKVIIAELNWFATSEREITKKIVNLLLDKGYALYYQNDYNGIFVDKRIGYE